jgi:WD40 repeat protein
VRAALLAGGTALLPTVVTLVAGLLYFIIISPELTGPSTSHSEDSPSPLSLHSSYHQFIKVLTLDGETLNVIRYHDGILGQRIGPVATLAFHPTSLLLAAGATDSIISIYSPQTPL